MRASTIFLYQRIQAYYDSGRREPKTVAKDLMLTTDVVYKALRYVFHVKHSSTDTRRKISFNSPNKSK